MPPRPKSACIPRPVQLSMCRSIEQVPEINELEKLQLRACLRTITRLYIDKKKKWKDQDDAQIDRLLTAARETCPFLGRYQDCWPVEFILRCRTAGTIAKRRSSTRHKRNTTTIARSSSSSKRKAYRSDRKVTAKKPRFASTSGPESEDDSQSEARSDENEAITSRTVDGVAHPFHSRSTISIERKPSSTGLDADHEMSELDELEDEPSVSGSTIAARETTESATVCSANNGDQGSPRAALSIPPFWSPGSPASQNHMFINTNDPGVANSSLDALSLTYPDVHDEQDVLNSPPRATRDENANPASSAFEGCFADFSSPGPVAIDFDSSGPLMRQRPVGKQSGRPSRKGKEVIRLPNMGIPRHQPSKESEIAHITEPATRLSDSANEDILRPVLPHIQAEKPESEKSTKSAVDIPVAEGDSAKASEAIVGSHFLFSMRDSPQNSTLRPTPSPIRLPANLLGPVTPPSASSSRAALEFTLCHPPTTLSTADPVLLFLTVAFPKHPASDIASFRARFVAAGVVDAISLEAVAGLPDDQQVEFFRDDIGMSLLQTRICIGAARRMAKGKSLDRM